MWQMAMPSNISKLGCFEQNYNDIIILIHTSLLKIESFVIKGGQGCYVVANSSIHSPHLW